MLSILLVFSTSVLKAGIFDEGDAANGQTLFNANCASCHKVDDGVLAAPGLGGIADRWDSSEEMLVKWIMNPNGAIESGDPYIKSLISQYEASFGIMTPQPVNEDQIKDIFAYIANPPLPPGGDDDNADACPTIHDNDDEVESAAGIWFLIIGILFLIIALSAAGANRSLKNASLESQGKEAQPNLSYMTMVMQWMSRNKAFVSVIGLFGVCYFVTVSYIGAMGIGVYEGYEPEQPIWFSHAVHNCENEIDCEYCHHSARKGRHAGIPSTNVCMNCHKGIKEGSKTGTEEINKIYAAIGFDPATGAYKEDHVEDPIKWVKVHNLPDHVFFSHSQHVEVGGLDWSMKKTLKALLLAFTLIVSSLGTGFAQDFNRGFEAAHKGDYATALREWRPLAENGDAKAQYHLGLMYDRGWGVTQDYSESVKWYRKAAEQGNSDSQHAIGLMYAFGRGFTQDFAEALQWYRKAAEQGNSDSQLNIGLMFGLGFGVPQDHISAHMWLNIAAANGNEDALEGRNTAAKVMTTADISEAQRRARICMESNYQNCD